MLTTTRFSPSDSSSCSSFVSRYSCILDKIEANNYDNFEKRAYTSKFEKLALLPGAWWKTRQ